MQRSSAAAKACLQTFGVLWYTGHSHFNSSYLALMWCNIMNYLTSPWFRLATWCALFVAPATVNTKSSIFSNTSAFSHMFCDLSLLTWHILVSLTFTLKDFFTWTYEAEGKSCNSLYSLTFWAFSIFALHCSLLICTQSRCETWRCLYLWSTSYSPWQKIAFSNSACCSLTASCNISLKRGHLCRLKFTFLFRR